MVLHEFMLFIDSLCIATGKRLFYNFWLAENHFQHAKQWYLRLTVGAILFSVLYKMYFLHQEIGNTLQALQNHWQIDDKGDATDCRRTIGYAVMFLFNHN